MGLVMVMIVVFDGELHTERDFKIISLYPGEREPLSGNPSKSPFQYNSRQSEDRQMSSQASPVHLLTPKTEMKERLKAGDGYRG